MPRYSLKRSPWAKMTSPGVSSVPASIQPSMTVSAPAAIALATSPDEVMPPSAITGTPWRAATSATSWTAVICGTPTPATIRVVQIEPGPMPTFTASAPASISASAASAVAMLPAIDLELARQALDPRDHLDHAARVAVRRVDDEHVDAGRDQRLGALARVRADADRGADAQPARRVLGRARELDPLLDVLDRDQALEDAVRVDDRQLLDPVAVQQLLGLVERRPDRRGDEAARRHQRRDRLRRGRCSKRRSRLVRMPTSRPPRR